MDGLFNGTKNVMERKEWEALKNILTFYIRKQGGGSKKQEKF